jgi:tripeptidyl-peptidase-1
MVAIGPILITIATATVALGHRIGPRSYEIKERHNVPSQWKRLRPAAAETMLELRIALKQSRFDELERHLYEGDISF